MLGDRYKAYWHKGRIPALIIASAFIYLLNISWLRWGSLLIDTGRELYVPWSILSGKMLYKDIFYEFGPLTPYLNALLCVIFGVHIRSFIIAGILTVVLMCILIYKISRIFLAPIFSTLSVLTFLFVFAFNQHYEAGIFNYIIPYSYASIYSMLFAITTLFFYYYILTKEKKAYTYLCGFFVLLTLATRIEIGIMLIVAIFIGIILDSPRGNGFKKRFRMILTCCLFPVLAVSLVYGLFAIITRGSIIDKDVFLINLDTKGPLTGHTLGTINFWKNTSIISKTILYYIGISTLFFAGGWALFLIRKFSIMKKTFLIIILAYIVMSLTVLFQREFFPYDMQYRCAPIICAWVFIFAYRKYRRTAEKKFLFLMIFSIFSLLLMTRMLFAVKAEHNGFYLLVPGMLCCYFFFLKIIPETFTTIQIRNFYRFGFVVLSASFIISQAALSHYMYKNRTLEISSPRGAMRVRPGYYRCKQLLTYLRENTDPSESLVVFPEGLTLNFLSERESPMHQYAFLPLLFKNPDFEKGVIKDLEDNEVKYIVILRRDTSDYGASRFGIDYAQGIIRYLAKHYVIEKQFGPWPFTRKEFSLALLRRSE